MYLDQFVPENEPIIEDKFNPDLSILVLGQLKPIMFGYIKMMDATLI